MDKQAEAAAEQQRQNNLVYGKPIASYIHSEVRPKIFDIIKDAYYEAGFNQVATQELIDDLTKRMTEDLKRFHNELTFKEVREAFKLGIRKEFGPFLGISIMTMNEWLNKYKELPGRKAALYRMAQHFKQPVKEKEYSKEEAEAIMKTIPDRLVKEWGEGKAVANLGNSEYEYLERIGLIPVGDYKKNIDQARQIEKTELLAKRKITWDSLVFKNINEELKRLEDKEYETVNMRKIAGTLSIIEWLKRGGK